MHRPMLAVFAALLLAGWLAGCNSATPTPAPTATPAASATPEDTATPEPTETPEATATPELATRDNPMPLGQDMVVTLDAGGHVSFGVTEVLTGDEAMATLKRENRFNADPGEGNQWVLARLHAAVDGDVPESLTKWDQSVWSAVSNGRAFDDKPFVMLPSPKFEGEVVPPAEIEGWAAWVTPATDDLQLVFLRTADRGGYWFATK